ncbi:MAG: hypothetical protein HOE83_04905 [Alphaproteobacteria bacterium]|jgi:hypothetical protein|nr:hypothetical protein [Alphaproteobacteria bacterium]
MPPRPKLNAPTKTLNVTFLADARDAIAERAYRDRISDGAVVRNAVDQFLLGIVDGVTAIHEIDIEADLVAAIKQAEPTSEPSLANTEKGFELGVEAACELMAKNSRMALKMATGITMGEDIAARIKKELLSG